MNFLNTRNLQFHFNRAQEDKATENHRLPKRNADELFTKTLENQCNEGEAYCWSICQTLPTECNLIDDAVCIDGHMLRCK